MSRTTLLVMYVFLAVIARRGSDELRIPSFRRSVRYAPRPRNLEIPGLVLAHRTRNDGFKRVEAVTCRPPAASCAGSSASRAASPIRLTLRMAIDSNRPGQKISDGLI